MPHRRRARFAAPTLNMPALLVALYAALSVAPHADSHSESEPAPAPLGEHGHGCGHVHAPREEELRTAVRHREEGGPGRRRQAWGALRVVPHFEQLEADLSDRPIELAVVRDRVVPDAVRWLSKALRVRSLDGALRLDRPCRRMISHPLMEEILCTELDPAPKCGRFDMPEASPYRVMAFIAMALCSHGPI